MSRIFLSLSLFAVLLLVVNIVIGFTIGDLNTSAQRLLAAHAKARKLRAGTEERRDADREVSAAALEYRPLRTRYGLHSLCGIASALVTVLVNSISITYFVGTGRWCREVVEAYHLSDDYVRQSASIKRRTFPWALFGVLTIIAIAAFGAASDLGANYQTAPHWVTVHLTVAIVGTAFIAWSFLVQVGNIGANYEVIEKILDEVQRVRGETSAAPTNISVP